MRWSPRALPKLRLQTAKHLADPAAPVRANTGAGNRVGLDLALNQLRAAEMFWVTPDMTALAMSAGSSLAAARWMTADRPSPFGLLVFGDGVGCLDAQGVEVPVDACTWGPSPEDCTVWLWVARWRVAEIAAESGTELVVEQIPPLIPIQSCGLPVTPEPVPFADLPKGTPLSILSALAATWLLMQQPTLSERSIERPEKSVRSSLARAGMSDPEVSIIDLRRLYVPEDRDPGGESNGRAYRHRWVVSGHWRDQPYGPERSLRRKTWIPAYVKGPDGAPLLQTERVNVWRR